MVVVRHKPEYDAGISRHGLQRACKQMHPAVASRAPFLIRQCSGRLITFRRLARWAVQLLAHFGEVVLGRGWHKAGVAVEAVTRFARALLILKLALLLLCGPIRAAESERACLLPYMAIKIRIK